MYSTLDEDISDAITDAVGHAWQFREDTKKRYMKIIIVMVIQVILIILIQMQQLMMIIIEGRGQFIQTMLK